MWQQLGKTKLEKLVWAIDLGDEAAALRLIADGAPVNGVVTRTANAHTTQATPLIEAVTRDKGAVCLALLAAGADPNEILLESYTALEWAALRGRTALFEALLAHGADPEPRRNDFAGRFATPMLHHAAAGGAVDILRLLVARGADIFAMDAAGRLPVDRAVDLRRDAAAAWLRAQAAERGREPTLHEAAAAGDVARLKVLLAAGHGVDERDTVRQRTPLHLAMLRAQPDAVRLLLARGADANARDDAGHVPLTLSTGDPTLIKLLLKAGADPNAAGPQGLTATLWSVQERFGLKALRLLLEAGGDARASAPDGRDVLALAPSDMPAVRRFLRELTGAAGDDMDAVRDQIRQFPALAARPEFVALAASLGARFDRPGTAWRRGRGVRYFHEVPITRIAAPQPGVIRLAAFAGSGIEAEFAALQDEAEAAGCLLLQTAPRPENGRMSMLLLPTTAYETALLARGTNAANHGFGTRQIIAWLRDLGTAHPFRLTAVGFDFLCGRFLAPPADADALAARMLAFCPELGDGKADTVSRLAREIVATRRFAFWWD
jgi:ankyrin repeat protein